MHTIKSTLFKYLPNKCRIDGLALLGAAKGLRREEGWPVMNKVSQGLKDSEF